MKLEAIVLSLAATTGSIFCAALPDVVWQTDSQPHGVIDTAFSTDGQRLVSASMVAKLWSIDGSLVQTFSILNDDVAAVALSPDGERLVAGGGSGGFRIWRISDGSVLTSVQGGSPLAVQDIAFSTDGARLARCSRSIGISDATNIYDGILIDEVHYDVVRSIVFSPDSSLIASSGDDNRAAFCRVSDGMLVQRFEDHPGAVAFTPDGQYFVFGNADGTSSFWDLQTNGLARVFPGWGNAARFSPDGRLLLTITGGTPKFWRVSDGRLLVSYDGVTNARCIDMSPDGKFFTYGGSNLVLARVPLYITEFTLDGAQAVLRWNGGSGLYQLQSCTNLLDNSWGNIGAATTNTFATNTTSATLFFRVQSRP